MQGVTGINAIAFKYRDGVIAGVDTGATYGKRAVYGIQSVFRATDECLIVFTGLLSDVQFLRRFIKEELEADVRRKMDPQGIHKMIQRILYSKRSELEPLAVSVIVCGMNKKENEIFEATDEKGRIIGVANSKGNFWFDDSAAISFSAHFALPLIRAKNLDELDREGAMKLMEECFRIMCYKDCRATNVIQIGFVEEKETGILEPQCVQTEWGIGQREDEILVE